jgi:Mrp family chromosome partitioning ATPase
LPDDLALPGPGQRLSTDLIAFHQPNHPATAEYRQLATALSTGSSAGPSRVLLCLGVAPGAGTTTVVLNLAVCFAASEGQRVVVVDAAEARPAVADRLGLRGHPGLAEVLAGSESLEQALQETGVARLTALTAGRAEGQGVTRLIDEACRPVLRLLRDRFDVVLIDGGTRAGGLGRACDAAYLVVPRGEAEARATSERARTLLGEGAPLRGCIRTAC